MRLKQRLRIGFGWYTTICILIFAWILNALGAFENTDSSFYDACQRITAKPCNDSHVLLIETPSSYFQNDRVDPNSLNSLLQQLAKHEPRVIGVVIGEGLHSLNPLGQNANIPKIILGKPLHTLVDESNDVNLKQANTFTTGYSDLRLHNQAVYRTSQTKVQRQGKEFHSFETQLVKEMVAAENLIPQHDFNIRFGKSSNGLPTLKVSELLDGNLIPGLVKNKAVIIAPESTKDVSFVTPLTADGGLMSSTELRGNIVETLVRQNSFRESSTAVNIIVLSFLTVLFCQIARQMSSRRWIAALVALAIVSIGIAICSFYLASTMLPISAILTCLALAFFVTLLQRFNKQSEALHHVYLMTKVKKDSGEVLSEEDVWKRVADAAHQLFYAQRMALMQLDDGATHVRLIETINCDESHISERRRDILREPLRDALEKAEPVEVVGRSLFTAVEGAPGVDYLVPLGTVAKPLGIIFLSLSKRKVQGWKNLPELLSQFSSNMTQFIGENRAQETEKHEREQLLSRLSTTPDQSFYDELQRLKFIENEQTHASQNIFRQTETPAAVYDIFGHVVTSNDRFNELVQAAEISADATCIDALSKLSEQSVAECRGMLRQLVSSQKPIDMLVLPSGQRHFSRRILLKPVQLSSDSSGDKQGLILEVADDLRFQEVTQCQRQNDQQLFKNTKQQLEFLKLLLAQQASQSELDSAATRLMEQTLQTTIDNVMSLSNFNDAGEQAHLQVVDLQIVIDAVVARFHFHATTTPIEFKIELAKDSIVKIGSLQSLMFLVESICDALIGSSLEDEIQLQITTEKVGEQTLLEFQIEDGWLDASGVDTLNQFASTLDTWGARLSIEKGTSGGTRVELLLTSSHLDDLIVEGERIGSIPGVK